jgi:hypothetical protein
MRKTIATVVILGLVWIGYIAWPLYDLVLVRAIETRDLDGDAGCLFRRGACVAHESADQNSTSVRSGKVWPWAPWGSPTQL